MAEEVIYDTNTPGQKIGRIPEKNSISVFPCIILSLIASAACAACVNGHALFVTGLVSVSLFTFVFFAGSISMMIPSAVFSYFLSVLMGSGWTKASSAAVPLILSLTAALCLKKKSGLCRAMMVTSGVSAFILLAFTVYFRYDPSLGAWKSMMGVIDSLENYISSYVASLISMSGASTASVTETTISGYTSYILALLPGLIFAFIEIIFYIVFKIVKALGVISRKNDVLFPDGFDCIPGRPEALIFLICFAGQLFLSISSSDSPVYGSFTNIAVAFAFPLCVYGLASVFIHKKKDGTRRTSPFLVMLLIMLILFSSTVLVIYATATLGAIFTLKGQKIDKGDKDA